jgi:hypothetical protein
MREFVVRRAGIEPTTLVFYDPMSRVVNLLDKGVFPIRM